MNTPQHLLAVIEPTDDGDSSVDIAREFVSKGGRATVILMITSQVRHDIREFADAESLHPSHAEAIALEEQALVAARAVEDDDRIGARILDIAASVGLDTAKLRRDMASPEVEQVIARNYARAEKLKLDNENELLEVGALLRESIQIRRLQMWMAMAGEIAPAPVVSVNEKNVRALLRSN